MSESLSLTTADNTTTLIANSTTLKKLYLQAKSADGTLGTATQVYQRWKDTTVTTYNNVASAKYQARLIARSQKYYYGSSSYVVYSFEPVIARIGSYNTSSESYATFYYYDPDSVLKYSLTTDDEETTLGSFSTSYITYKKIYAYKDSYYDTYSYQGTLKIYATNGVNGKTTLYHKYTYTVKTPTTESSDSNTTLYNYSSRATVTSCYGSSSTSTTRVEDS